MITKNKIFNYFFATILAMVFYTAFVVSDELVNGVWTAKTFYFYEVSVIILVVATILLLIRKKELKFSFTVLDISFVTYYLYNLIRLLFTEYVPFYNARIVQFTFLLIFYFIFKKYFNDFTSNKFTQAYILIIAFLAAGFWQASIGLFQSHNLFGYYSGYFKVLGTFGNPAPYTGFIISVLPFSLGLFLLLDNKSIFTKVLKYGGSLTFAVAFLVLPATKTRGGWLAAIAGMLAVAYYKFNFSVKLKTIFNKRYKKVIAILSLLSIVIFMFVGLYQIRPSSAFGRLLIWKVSLTKVIPQNPIFGIGFDRFGQVYNRYQGDYFAEKDRDEFEKYVAGNVKQAHNEYIEQFAELGLLGVLLFIGLLSSSLYGGKFTIPNKQSLTTTLGLQYSARASVIALMVSACFSYPFQILPTLLNFVFLISIISSTGNYKTLQILKLSKLQVRLIVILLLPLLLLFSVSQLKNYNNIKKWSEAVQLSHFQMYDKAITIYEQLHNNLKNNGNFLVNYGGVLALNKKYSKAIEILEEGEIINSDPNLFISLGNSYKKNEEPNKAIDKYKIASSIIPHKFYPKYLLAKLFYEKGSIKQAKDLAKEIVTMKEKIKSTATYQIKKEMKELINNNLSDEAKQLNIN